MVPVRVVPSLMPELFDGPRLGDRYALGPLLGRGAVGEVRAGWDEHLGRRVAVKMLLPGARADLGNPARFRVEAIAAARLTSPHVVALLDIGEHEGSPFLVMEQLSGLTWADELRGSRPDDGRVLAVVDDVLAGLQATHAAGIVHRDVKPSNVLLMDDGSAKLGDFGIAQAADLTTITFPGTVVGTFAYLAPERLGGAAATPASDVWSVGVLLYESLTGQRPFSGDAPLAVAAAVQRGTYPALETARPDVRAATCSAVESALSPDPATRPSVEDLRATLTLAAPAHEAPARAASLVAVPALGAVDVLTQWLTPLVDAEKAPVNIPRRRRLRAWTVPGLVLGGVAAMVVVTTGAAGPGGPGASAGTPRADAAAAAPDTSPGPEPIPVKAPAPSRTAHPVRPAKTASPPGTSRGSSHAHRSATPTGSELSSAAGRQPQPDALHEQPNTVKNQEKTNGQQKGKGKQKGKAQGNARGEEGQGLAVGGQDLGDGGV